MRKSFTFWTLTTTYFFNMQCHFRIWINIVVHNFLSFVPLSNFCLFCHSSLPLFCYHPINQTFLSSLFAVITCFFHLQCPVNVLLSFLNALFLYDFPQIPFLFMRRILECFLVAFSTIWNSVVPNLESLVYHAFYDLALLLSYIA